MRFYAYALRIYMYAVTVCSLVAAFLFTWWYRSRLVNLHRFSYWSGEVKSFITCTCHFYNSSCNSSLLDRGINVYLWKQFPVINDVSMTTEQLFNGRHEFLVIPGLLQPSLRQWRCLDYFTFSSYYFLKQNILYLSKKKLLMSQWQSNSTSGQFNIHFHPAKILMVKNSEEVAIS